MQEAVDKMASVFGTSASIAASYTAGTVTIAGLTPTVGKTMFEVQDGSVIIAFESRDYILPAAALVDSSGNPIIPASGHTFTETVSGKVYQVSAPKPNDFYERIGPTGSVLKIHTKAI